jgi:hypothetical protein
VVMETVSREGEAEETAASSYVMTGTGTVSPADEAEETETAASSAAAVLETATAAMVRCW